MFEAIKKVRSLKNYDYIEDNMLLKTFTAGQKFKVAADMYAKKEAQKWEESQNKQMISYSKR